MARDTFVHRLGALATLLDPTRRKLYQEIVRRSDPVSRDEAAEAVGVSRAMAAFHLDRLVDAGLLRADYRRLSGRAGRGAGRPSKLYRRSRRRLELAVPTRHHELLSALLAEALLARSPDRIPATIGHQYGRSLGVRAHNRLRDVSDRRRLRRCVEDVVADLGFEPTTSASGELWARNCPFDPVSRRFPAVVCETAVGLVGGVIEGVGASDLVVSRAERRGWCCVIATPRESASERAP